METTREEKLKYITEYIDKLGNKEFSEEQQEKHITALREDIPAYPTNSSLKEKYLFISYSHRDFREVYRDLAEFLYKTDKCVRFWYDEGIPAGDKWQEVINEHLKDKNCIGVIFYLSENLLYSPSVIKEIKLFNDSRTNKKNSNFFYINVDNGKAVNTLKTMELGNYNDKLVEKNGADAAPVDVKSFKIIKDIFSKDRKPVQIYDTEKISKIANKFPAVIYSSQDDDSMSNGNNIKILGAEFDNKNNLLKDRKPLDIYDEKINKKQNKFSSEVYDSEQKKQPKAKNTVEESNVVKNNEKRIKLVFTWLFYFVRVASVLSFITALFFSVVYYVVPEMVISWPMAMAFILLYPLLRGFSFFLENYTDIDHDHWVITILLGIVIFLATFIFICFEGNWYRKYNEIDEKYTFSDRIKSYDKDFENGYRYDANDVGYSIWEYLGNETTIIIPDEYRGKPITHIYPKAFEGCSELTNITIPDTITNIGTDAFNDCINITQITAPSMAIAYLPKTKVKTVIITSGTYIDDFEGCTGLTSITIPDSATSIGSAAFYGCTGLTSITIPDSVTSIGGSAFEGCTGLTSITIPDSVTSIYDSAFSGCTGLTSITIPDGVTSIYDSAFSGCTGLTSVTIGNRVTSIGDDSFSSCKGLTSITIPDSVTRIGEDAFSGCTGLTSITIPDSVTRIGKGAFSGCTGLTSITLPFVGESKDATGYNGVFGYIFGFTITESSDAVNGATYQYQYSYYSNYHYFIPSSIRTVIITNDTGIYYTAFRNCTGLTSVTIPNSVTSIGGRAFEGCTNLTSIKCRAYRKPAGWSDSWNEGCDAVVEWGYTGE